MFFNLQSSTVDHVLRTVGRPHFSFLNLQTEISGVTMESFPARVTPVTRAHFILTGKVTVTPATDADSLKSSVVTVPLTLHFGYGSRVVVSKHVTLTIHREDLRSSQLIPKFFGTKNSYF